MKNPIEFAIKIIIHHINQAFQLHWVNLTRSVFRSSVINNLPIERG